MASVLLTNRKCLHSRVGVPSEPHDNSCIWRHEDDPQTSDKLPESLFLPSLGFLRQSQIRSVRMELGSYFNYVTLTKHMSIHSSTPKDMGSPSGNNRIGRWAKTVTVDSPERIGQPSFTSATLLSSLFPILFRRSLRLRLLLLII